MDLTENLEEDLGNFFPAAVLGSHLKTLVDELYELMTIRDIDGARGKAIEMSEKALQLYLILYDLSRITQKDQNPVSPLPTPPDRPPDYQ